MICALAIGFSSFTNAHKTNLATRYWLNDGTNYNVTTVMPDPDDHCGLTSSSAECSVESNDTSIPNQFPISNPNGYNITTFPGASDSVYQ